MGGKALVFAALIAIFCGTNNGEKFLKKKQDFLHTCERKTADFHECFANALQNIFSEWQNGVAGTENTLPLDPMFVDNFKVIEDRENVAPIAVQMTNISVTGLSQAKVYNVSINDKDYNFKLSYTVPSIRLDGHYSACGQILVLKIDTMGKMFMEIINGEYSIAVKVKLRQQDDYKFFDLKSLKFRVKTIENVRLNFENLFRDKALNDNTNAVFNESWRSFFDMVKPEIEREINPVLFEHFQRIFNSVPANFFVADVASDSS